MDKYRIGNIVEVLDSMPPEADRGRMRRYAERGIQEGDYVVAKEFNDETARIHT